MTPERWSRIKGVFQAALDLPVDERPPYLDRECGDDEAFRRQVERLLEADEQSTSPLEEPAWELGAGLLSRSKSTSLAGRRIGRHRILREIGRGGMGTVYLAVRDDGQYREEVAIKLIKRGMDTDAIIDRFRRERQILADLHHPSIARIFDGGVTDEGLPYFVMEYIEGEPIDTYCDAHGLGVRDRLELFRGVCAAVHAAHRRLIVHCDLKPSNILVTGDGIPKLVDFGVAKLLDPERGSMTLTQSASERLLTPKYASPEQIQGEPLTTATDVYSLGVVLYELLTGQRPYRFAERSRREIERVICEQEPEKPSLAARRGGASEKLRRRLAGDLDNIALMALRKETEQRYGSVEQLSEDVRRHLDGLPVRARRPTYGYRVGKFLRRHRLAVSTLLLVLATLLSGIVTTTLQKQEADRQKLEAEWQRNAAEQIRDFLVGLFKTSDPGEAEFRNLTLRQVLDRGAANIESELLEEPVTRAALLDTLGEVYRDVGLAAQAEPLIEDALRIRRQTLGPQHPSVGISLNNLGLLRLYQGNHDAAEDYLRHGLELRRQHFDGAHEDVAESLNSLALLLRAQREYDAAEALYREALAMRRELLGPEHQDVATSLNNLAVVLRRKGESEEAEGLFREALELRRQLLGEEHVHVADTLNNLAVLLRVRGELSQAEALYREALAMRRKLLGNEHTDVIETVTNLATLLFRQARYDESEALYREALASYRQLLGNEHPDVAATLSNLATLLYQQARYGEAEPLFRQALIIYRQRFGEDHLQVAKSMTSLALGLWRAGDDLGEAESLLRRALELHRRHLGPEHPKVARNLMELGGLLTEQGKSVEAEPLLRGSLEIFRAGPPDPARMARAQTFLGSSLTALGRFAEAEPLLLTGFSTLTEDRGKDHRWTSEARRALVTLYESWGRPAEAKRLTASKS